MHAVILAWLTASQFEIDYATRLPPPCARTASRMAVPSHSEKWLRFSAPISALADACLGALVSFAVQRIDQSPCELTLRALPCRDCSIFIAQACQECCSLPTSCSFAADANQMGKSFVQPFFVPPLMAAPDYV